MDKIHEEKKAAMKLSHERRNADKYLFTSDYLREMEEAGAKFGAPYKCGDGGVVIEELAPEDIRKRHEESKRFKLKLFLGFLIASIIFWAVYFFAPGMWNQYWIIGFVLPFVSVMSLLGYFLDSCDR